MYFAIFTHVPHQEQEGRFFAYSPYVREMNIWLKYAEEVEVVGPAVRTPKREYVGNDFYLHSNLSFTKIPAIHLLSYTGLLKSIFCIPIIVFKISVAMKRANHIHLRCPGNIGLLACICQIFFPQKLKTAKYAGNWDPQAKQPWSYRLQKWILGNTFLTKNMQVLVYGNWPDQSKNINPFFTASFSEHQIEKIQTDFSAPFKFLFVGNLVPGKQPLFAVRLVEALKEKNINAQLHVFGDGEMMDSLKAQRENKSYIHLHGSQPLEVVKQAYKESQFLILASKSEGWPKAVAEAMFFGCIPVASSVSCVPWMLAAPPAPEGGAPKVTVTGRGILISTTTGGGNIKTDWIEETSKEIQKLIKYPKEMRRMSLEAQEWSQQYTLEKFEREIEKLLFPENMSNRKSSSPFGRGGGEG